MNGGTSVVVSDLRTVWSDLNKLGADDIGAERTGADNVRADRTGADRSDRMVTTGIRVGSN